MNGRTTSRAVRRAFPCVLASCALALAAPAFGDEELELAPEEEPSDQCRAYREDPHADLGEVMRAGCEPTLAQMSRLMDNPLGNVAMLFTQIDWYKLTNEQQPGIAENQYNYMGILQFPKGISDEWNLISRVIWNVPSVPLSQSRIDKFGSNPAFQPPGGGSVQAPSTPNLLPIDVFGGRTTGFGDMYYNGLFSPKEAIKHRSGAVSVWGLGLDASFPTASEEVLGSGKWSLGPTALYAYLGPKWKVGGLLQQYFSVAGPGSRDDVNVTNLQYLVYYSISDTMSIGAGPNIIANWEADSGDRWTVPIGIGINKTFQFGKLPVRMGVEFHYNVVRPETVGSQFNLRFFIVPAVPSAMFGFLD